MLYEILTRKSLYSRLISDISKAKKRVIIHAYIWLNDEAGISVAESVLRAADSGVKVIILKDLSASIFEHTPGRTPFFIRKSDLQKDKGGFMSIKMFNKAAFYIYRKQLRPEIIDNPIFEEMLSHKNISITNVPLFNHGKLIIVDDTSYVPGQCIGDDYNTWIDYTIKIQDKTFTEDTIQKSLEEKINRSNKQTFFLQNTFSQKLSIYHEIKLFIDSLKKGEELIIEMAYFGFWFYNIIKNAINRGVIVSILGSRESDTNQDTNIHFLNKLIGLNNKNLHIYLSDRMIHTKGIVTRSKIIIGAANFHSANGYFKGLNEQDIYSEDKKLSTDLFKIFEGDLKTSTLVLTKDELPKFNIITSIIERAFVKISSYFIFFNMKKVQKYRDEANAEIRNSMQE